MKLRFGCQKCRRHEELTVPGTAPFISMVDCRCGSCMLVTQAVGEIVIRRAAA